MSVFVIGIAGPSGAGKTTIANALASELRAPVISLDSYYYDLADAPLDERARKNFDHPEALEHQLLFHHLFALRKGHSVKLPVYDFATHTRVPRMYRTLAPSEFLIVEGLFLLHWHVLREALDLRVYIDAHDEHCFQRRRRRDVEERGRTQESVDLQYVGSVRPMADKFIRPSKLHADLVLDGLAPVQDSLATLRHAIETRRSKVTP
ncbi:MAG: uridine kinase [Acidobacteriales bacterium]|nr:uridine kinase [Terriglobales bacterium]